jgi:GT2 family glycosyltransferase
MNADMLFTPKTKLNELIKYMDSHSDVGMLGNEVQDFYSHKLDPDNRHQVPTLLNGLGQSLGLYKIFPKVHSLNYYMTYLKDDETAEVGGVGGFMLFREQLLKNVGYLDERFRIYCQDSDFCYRTIKRGWKIIYYPKSNSIHIGGGSVKRFSIKNQVTFHEDLWRYYKKNLVNKYPFFVKYIVALSLIARFFIFTVFEISVHVVKK